MPSSPTNTHEPDDCRADCNLSMDSKQDGLRAVLVLTNGSHGDTHEPDVSHSIGLQAYSVDTDSESLDTGTPETPRSRTEMAEHDRPIGCLLGCGDLDNDDVFIVEGRADGRGSPVSDCTEDSGIGTEESGDARSRLLQKSGCPDTFYSHDLNEGFKDQQKRDGMLFQSLQNAMDNNILDQHRLGTGSILDQCGSDFAPSSVNWSGPTGKSHCGDVPGATRGNCRGSEPREVPVIITDDGGEPDPATTMTPSTRPPHIIPPTVRRIMRHTSQSAPSSPIGRRRRVVSEYIPRSSCNSPFPCPPPSFPAPASPAPSSLLAGDVPPPAQRKRSRRSRSSRSSWDPHRLNSSFDPDSPLSSRSITPTKEYPEDHLRFPFNVRSKGHPSNPDVMSTSDPDWGSHKIEHRDSIGSGSDTSSEMKLDLGATSARREATFPDFTHNRQRETSCSGPRPQIPVPPSQSLDSSGPLVSSRTRPRTRSRTSQAVVAVSGVPQSYCRSPAIHSKNRDHLPPDHRIRVSQCRNVDEVMQKASPLQLQLLRSKKAIEKELSSKLEQNLEQQDKLMGAIRRSMDHARTKDQVMAAKREVKQVICSDVVEDKDTHTKYYKVEVDLGNYTSNVSTNVSLQIVSITGATPEPPRYTKEINIEFPDMVNMQRIDILQIGHKMILGAPFKSSACRKPSLPNILEPESESKEPGQRIAFLEGLFQSLQLPWPPDGATAHYEYLTGRYMGVDKPDSDNINYDYIFSSDVEQQQLQNSSVQDARQHTNADSDDFNVDFNRTDQEDHTHEKYLHNVNAGPTV